MFKTIEDCRLDLVGSSGDDFMPCRAARVSFGKEDKTGKDVAADIKLLNYLAKHKHYSPFEHQSATFLVEVPLFIRSQIMRHRTFAYNEISRRYTDENIEFWIPTTFRKQSESNRQASTDEVVTHTLEKSSYEGDPLAQRPIPLERYYQLSAKAALFNYDELIAAGVCREQARAVLPQSLLTKFYMTGNLRNWTHFIQLRKDAHAQKEVQIVAERIEVELRKLWPNSVEALLGKS